MLSEGGMALMELDSYPWSKSTDGLKINMEQPGNFILEKHKNRKWCLH